MTEKASFHQHNHQPWPIFWVRSDEARLVGKMLHWRESNDHICSEGVFHFAKRRRVSEDTWWAQMLLPEPKFLPGAWTSVISNWNDGRNYFHWLLDGLTRLSVREQLPEATSILIPDNPSGFVTETLRLLGLEDQVQSAPAGCVRPERFYFCSPTAMTGVWNPIGYQWLRQKFSPYYAEAGSGPAVFLTRRGASRLPANLAEIESRFTDRGFLVIDCGSLSVQEQIRALSAAPTVAGLHGAAMTNLLWVRPGTPVLEIFQPGYLNACYEQIAFHGELNYSYYIQKDGEQLNKIDEWLSSTL